MEARVTVRPLLLLLGLALLLRLPFLNQAIQGDDHIYLTEAEHALIDPLHPNNTRYVFLGTEVDLRGHSHPPGNAWPLAALIAVLGGVKEVPFHAAYMVFTLLAVWAAWSLAARFAQRPVWAVLLFLAVPAFVVNGNSLEADLPFLAFFLAAIALSSAGLLACSCIAMAAAAMMAYQAVFLVPILVAHTWIFHRRSRTRYVLAFTPAVTIAAWQLFQRVTTGAMPASKLANYLVDYGFAALLGMVKGAAMLSIHFWFLLFPALLPPLAIAAWRRCREPATLFPILWIAIFFFCGLPIFFAGSARYLLPIALPLAILASRLPVKWLAPAFAVQLALGLGLAAANYQHWDGYRRFAASIRAATAGHRVWVDNDWGLRYYLEADHALPAVKDQHLRPGDIVVTSELGHNVEFTAPMVTIARAVIQPSIPFRLIGLESGSGYSTVAKGWWPFGISSGVVDRVEARIVRERHPVLEYLATNAPEAPEQIVSGVFLPDRWMGGDAVVLLKPPAAPRRLAAEIYVPPNAAAHRITLTLDGREAASMAIPRDGAYTVESSAPLSGSTVEIHVDRTFRAPGDQRDLGVVLLAVGFR
ncbi:MAG: hypothetical protein KGN36_03470 [Acidobacteriota bacterium]|nr:hypothetical protein [Acidobacteriota bacterium]